MSRDDPSMAANSSLLAISPANKQFYITLTRSNWVLCSTIIKTLVCFVYLLERQCQCHFTSFIILISTNAMHIFINLHQYFVITSLPEAIELYMITWQMLYAVTHSISIIYYWFYKSSKFKLFISFLENAINFLSCKFENVN